MDIERSRIKLRAKELILTSQPRPLVVGLIFLALSVVFSLLSSRIIGVNMTQENLQGYLTSYFQGNLNAAAKYAVDMQPPTSAYLVDLLLQLALGIVYAGFVIFLLNIIRGAAASAGNLLDGFGIFPRVLLLMILEGLFFFLWSMLLFVPGVIALYRYRQAIYLLLDHPEMSPLDCIRESKRMMRGRKWELFVFDLSFIGWFLLSTIPVLGYVVDAWFLPYKEMSYALYYERLRGADIYARRGTPGANPPSAF